MKKFYTMLALAAAVCGTATAGVKTTAITTAQTMQDNAVELNSKADDTKATRAAYSAEECSGYYVMNWYGRTSADAKHNTTGIQVMIDGTDATIIGLYDLAPVAATFDPAKGTLRISTGTKVLYRGTGGVQIQVYIDKLTVEGGKFTAETEQAFCDLQYLPEGAQMTSGEIALVGGWYLDPYTQISFNIPANRGTNNGYGWKYGVDFQNLAEAYEGFEPFKYNASSWEACGTAKLDDGWFRAITDEGEGYPAYDVECFKRDVPAREGEEYTSHRQILLKNPYGATSPYAANDASGKPANRDCNKEGYIVLDITNPECVLVMPFVNSSFSATGIYGFRESETSTTVSYPCAGTIPCASKEGFSYYIDAYEYQDIIDEAEGFGDALSTMTEAGVVTIPNCRVQYVEETDGYIVPMQWQNAQERPIPMESIITLPAAALTEGSGIQGIGSDLVNAPVKYYNLQGIELAAPVKGQLVIKKQGNKTVKFIAK